LCPTRRCRYGARSHASRPRGSRRQQHRRRVVSDIQELASRSSFQEPPARSGCGGLLAKDRKWGRLLQACRRGQFRVPLTRRRKKSAVLRCPGADASDRPMGVQSCLSPCDATTLVMHRRHSLVSNIITFDSSMSGAGRARADLCTATIPGFSPACAAELTPRRGVEVDGAWTSGGSPYAWRVCVRPALNAKGSLLHRAHR
jgi:hypothetical protein